MRYEQKTEHTLTSQHKPKARNSDKNQKSPYDSTHATEMSHTPPPPPLPPIPHPHIIRSISLCLPPANSV